jgi:regulator of nonsense transcripts 1
MSTAGSAVAAPRTGGAPSGVSAGKGGAKSGGRGGAGGGPGAGGGGKRKGAAAAAAAAALDDTASTGTRDEILRESAALEAEFREQMSPSAGGKGKALSTTAAPWEPSGALPPHACAYCTAHNPSSVVRCVRTGKWFCNGRGGTSGAHIVQHLVRSKCKEVCLHPESPLGDAVLECYNCGCRNVFLLGFIPSKTQTGVVVLLCREPCLNLEALKDAGWDLSLWQPIIEDRAFLPWLVHVPSKEEEAAARPVSAAQITGIEMLWRKKPDAGWTEFLAHGAGGGADGGADGASGAEASGAGGEGEPAPAPVLLRYEDGYEYQNLFGPLVKAEADESKLMTESLRQDGVAVRWESAKEGASAAGAAAGAAAGSGGSGGGGGVAGGGGKRVLAHFRFARPDSELRLLAGDEMRLKLPSLATQLGISGLVSAAVSSAKGAAGAAAAAAGKGAKTSGGGSAAEDEDAAWVGTGVVRGVADGEVTVEITSHSGGSKADGIPLGTTAGFIVELVWRSVTFDRMQAALRTFATDERSVSIFLYHALLGHPLEPTVLPVALPAEIKAPRLPALNASQEAAVRTVLQRPLSLIQVRPCSCVVPCLRAWRSSAPC